MSESGEDDQQARQGNKKLWLILAVFFVFNILAIGGVFFYLQGQSAEQCIERPVDEKDILADVVYCEGSKKATNTDPVLEPNGDLASDGVVLPEDLSGEPLFHKVGPMIVNLLESDRFEYIQFSVTLKTKSVKLITSVEYYDLALKNKFENVVRGYGTEEVVKPSHRAEAIAAIKEELVSLLEDEGFSPLLIEDLFLSDVIIE